ncbi:hypothetical protein NDR89_23225 [Cupriavidus gilardii]|uniref:Uncharacterized protein n=1 Tax=Cupriavidus gilardii TaxID=82541 RepID=A0ABY4VUJ5_9BURK|nr:hypothetical protein [Cupriavidus gilardii]USE79506.1 hypothetical protein NDR89_23225 [Cupriavidus gilardii]
MTSGVTDEVRNALLRGEAVVIPAFAAKHGLKQESVRHAIERLGSAVKCKVVKGKRGSATKVWTVADAQALRDWKPKVHGPKFKAEDFAALAEVFGIRPIKIKLPTHRHIMEGEWA